MEAMSTPDAPSDKADKADELTMALNDLRDRVAIGFYDPLTCDEITLVTNTLAALQQQIDLDGAKIQDMLDEEAKDKSLVAALQCENAELKEVLHMMTASNSAHASDVMKYKAQLAHCFSERDHERQTSEWVTKDLRAQLAERERDSKRIDWLCDAMRYEGDGGGGKYWFTTTLDTEDTLAAIDHEMKKDAAMGQNNGGTT